MTTFTRSLWKISSWRSVAPDHGRLNELKALRAERFELMARLAKLPSDMNFFTQITMEAAEDPEFLGAMRNARIKGALVGVESVTAEGLKDVYKGFNLYGEELVERLRQFKNHGIHVLGSFIFGLPSDRAETFNATAALALKADVTFAQFVMLTPFPGTVDFAKWELGEAKKKDAEAVDGIPITRHWLIPQARRPKVYTPHPTLSADEIRERTQGVWDQFYSLPHVWRRSRAVKSLKNRIGFVLCSKLYRQMYANTGIATDSARHAKSERMARLLAKPADDYSSRNRCRTCKFPHRIYRVRSHGFFRLYPGCAMKNAVLLLVVLLCGSGSAFGQAGQKPTGQRTRAGDSKAGASETGATEARSRGQTRATSARGRPL
jgi:hypothetical protein